MKWILVALIALSAAFGAALRLELVKLPLPAPAFFALAALLALILILSLLPLRARRVGVFATVLVALAAVAGGLYYFQFYIKPNMVKGFIAAAFAPKPTAVSVEEAKTEQWPPRLLAIGTTRAFQGIDVAPQVAGIVTAIHFKSSDFVDAGAPLLQLDDSTDQADLANGQAQLKNAQISLDRQQTLSVGGNTAQAQVDSARATRDSAAATVDKTKAIIAQKNLTAPFAGRLGIRKVDLGQYVGPGTAVVTLQQLDPVYVDFQTPEQSLAALKEGEAATMTLDAYPGENFSGSIKAIDARVSADTRNLLVRAEFPNPDKRLLPGMFANLEVTTGAPADVVTVPRTAVVYGLYGDNVFVVVPAPPKAAASGEAQAAPADTSADKGDSLVVERRLIHIGASRGERVEILDGVKAGERVVTSGQIKLQPNSPVTIDAGGGLPTPATTPRQ